MSDGLEGVGDAQLFRRLRGGEERSAILDGDLPDSGESESLCFAVTEEVLDAWALRVSRSLLRLLYAEDLVELRDRPGLGEVKRRDLIYRLGDRYRGLGLELGDDDEE